MIFLISPDEVSSSVLHRSDEETQPVLLSVMAFLQKFQDTHHAEAASGKLAGSGVNAAVAGEIMDRAGGIAENPATHAEQLIGPRHMHIRGTTAAYPVYGDLRTEPRHLLLLNCAILKLEYCCLVLCTQAHSAIREIACALSTGHILQHPYIVSPHTTPSLPRNPPGLGPMVPF